MKHLNSILFVLIFSIGFLFGNQIKNVTETVEEIFTVDTVKMDTIETVAPDVLPSIEIALPEVIVVAPSKAEITPINYATNTVISAINCINTESAIQLDSKAYYFNSKDDILFNCLELNHSQNIKPKWKYFNALLHPLICLPETSNAEFGHEDIKAIPCANARAPGDNALISRVNKNNNNIKIREG